MDLKNIKNQIKSETALLIRFIFKKELLPLSWKNWILNLYLPIEIR